MERSLENGRPPHAHLRRDGAGLLRRACICANLIALLANALAEAERRCRVFTTDVRARIRATGLDAYQDLTVVCTRVERDEQDIQALAYPVVPAEVTSPSAKAYDRGQELEHYEQIPSLREILIVSHSEARVDVWRQGKDARWTMESFDAGGRIHLTSLECEVSASASLRTESRSSF